MGMNLDSPTEREMKVLGGIVRAFVLNGSPVGSRFLSREMELGVSAATIRNVMVDLEERGLITHPHTSAGRIPTDLGYRYYVDHLMTLGILSTAVKDQIRGSIEECEPSDLHTLLDATSRALSRATDHLGVIVAPRLAAATLHEMHLRAAGERRFLLHLTLNGGFVKTMAIEITSDVDMERLRQACSVFSERMRGRRLGEIAARSEEMLHDTDGFDVGLIRLFVPALHKMLEQRADAEVFAEGQANILLKPEFFDRSKVSAVIEILEHKGLLMHLFEAQDPGASGVVISIGGENSTGVLRTFSVVKTRYRVGGMEGWLGVLGPTRMPYGYLAATVDYTAKLLSSKFGEDHGTLT